MNFRTTVILLACLAVLGGIYALSRGKDSAPVPGRPDATVDVLVQGDLVGVRVKFGRRAYELQKLSSGWAQTEPVWFPLSREIGQRWAWAAQDLTARERIDLEAPGAPSLKDLSLDPPTATVELITRDGAHQFGLGDQSVAGPGYMLTDRGEVVVVPSTIHELVYQQTPDAWYERRLPTPPLTRLQNLILHRGNQKVGLVRDPQGWILDAARRQRANPDLINELEVMLGGTPVLDVLDRRDDERFGLASPRATLTLIGDGEDSYQIAVGRAAAVDGGVFVEVRYNGKPGPVLVLPQDAVAPLAWPFDQVRDPRLFDASPGDLTAVRIERTHAPAIEARDTGTGIRYHPDSAPTPEDADTDATGLAEAVLALRAVAFVDDVALNRLPDAVIKARWGVTHEAQAAVFREGDSWLAKRAGEPGLFVLDPNALAALPVALDAGQTD